ncbi:MAG: hypothetical protein BWZ10_02113 [candidate division BRC1 bacterium ADurb.BinA364]|nr:MAG: hypothetical protein BWZ10_02113 [candidate division BRC1 bacterium ADurb.BinA364]
MYGAPLCVAAALACGPAFFVEGEARQGLARTAVGDFPLRDGGAGGPGRVCARPETFSLSPMQDADKNNAEAALLARIERSAFLAGRWKTHFWIKGQAFWTWTDGPLAPGELARARLEAAAWIPQETRE